MNTEDRIQAFSELGNLISKQKDKLKSRISNPWFTDVFVDFALNQTIEILKEDTLRKWVEPYDGFNHDKSIKRIGVISAGNIPLVGFHDFLSVLISGNCYVGKLSSKDNVLLAGIIQLLLAVEAKFSEFIDIKKETLSGFDAVIATGSNNSARYFEYYFGKYPHIIRKNRNSAAVLNGNESDEELKLLADDIFLYFGLGCRSVSKLFIPKEYRLDNIFNASLSYKDIINHTKYANNYDYNRAIYLLNQIDFKENTILIMKEDQAYASPVSVVYYEYYENLSDLELKLKIDSKLLQCIVSQNGFFPNSIPPGKSQRPELDDYADTIDTLQFLRNLHVK